MSETSRRGILAALLATTGLTAAATPVQADEHDEIDGGTP